MGPSTLEKQILGKHGGETTVDTYAPLSIYIAFYCIYTVCNHHTSRFMVFITMHTPMPGQHPQRQIDWVLSSTAS